jgi:SNF2 family DNA or RNA helicase
VLRFAVLQVKNARAQLAQRLRELRAVCRVIISGTPVQNNLCTHM